MRAPAAWIVAGIPQHAWKAPIPGIGMNWAELHAEQMTFGRRLSKLVDIGAVRRSMLERMPRISAAVASIGIDDIVARTTLTFERDELLGLLAKERARRAGEKLRRGGMPAFLPFLFAAESPLEAGAYGAATVSEHLRELKALRLAGGSKLPIDERVSCFQKAAERKWSLIEWLEPGIEWWPAFARSMEADS